MQIVGLIIITTACAIFMKIYYAIFIKYSSYIEVIVIVIMVGKLSASEHETTN